MLISEFKSDANIVDEDGRTALHLCYLEQGGNTQREECAKLLKDVTDPTIVDKFGQSVATNANNHNSID